MIQVLTVPVQELDIDDIYLTGEGLARRVVDITVEGKQIELTTVCVVGLSRQYTGKWDVEDEVDILVEDGQ